MSILWILGASLLGTPAAEAGYDVNFKGTTLTLRSEDGRPIADRDVLVSLDAYEATGPHWYGWLLPTPHWHWEGIGLFGKDRWDPANRSRTFKTDAEGRVVIPPVRKHWLLPNRKGASLRIAAAWEGPGGRWLCSLEYRGLKAISRVPRKLECGLSPHERLRAWLGRWAAEPADLEGRSGCRLKLEPGLDAQGRPVLGVAVTELRGDGTVSTVDARLRADPAKTWFENFFIIGGAAEATFASDVLDDSAGERGRYRLRLARHADGAWAAARLLRLSPRPGSDQVLDWASCDFFN